jgi:glucose-6-phosphate isomerase
MKNNSLCNANLEQLAFSFQNQSILSQFESDTERASRLVSTSGGLTYDYSKQNLNRDVLDALIELAESCQLDKKISKLLRGEAVNPTEGRPALHSALRAVDDTSLILDGLSVQCLVSTELSKMEVIVSKVHARQWRGFSGKPISDVVNIGVGGSDLGPFMMVEALQEFATSEGKKLGLHFVSSMDGSQLFKLLDKLNPETTLFIICSKSFTTVDTFYNADTAISWLGEACSDTSLAMKHHVIGVSANQQKMSSWGIPESNQLLFWDWVGGRFSLWSTIGLAIALKLGMDNFRQILAGANSIDRHFSEKKFSENIPVLMGLIGVWNSSFLKINAHSVLPYDGRLRYLPNYLTQLEMESNGKSITTKGEPVKYDTCPILWGDIGSNAQHAFYQLLHQGTQKVSCDFIAPVKRYHQSASVRDEETRRSLINQHELSLANCLAQSRVLAFGNAAVSSEPTDSFDESERHKQYRGNQPSSTILMNELTPFNLGALIAMYEHKVFVMATIWEINPFDQWGVELGKKLSVDTLNAIQSAEKPNFDQSTNQLIELIKTIKGEQNER